MTPDRTDRIAAHLAKLAIGSTALSSEEYRAGLDHLGSDANQGLMSAPPKKKPPTTRADGSIDMAALLSELLAACGVDVPYADDETEFKRQLCAACIQKIQEVSGKRPKRGSNPNATQNPLIQQAGGSGEISPMYMSVELTHEQADTALAAFLRGMGIH